MINSSASWNYLVLSTVVCCLCGLVGFVFVVWHIYLVQSYLSQEAKKKRPSLTPIPRPHAMGPRFAASAIHGRIISVGTVVSCLFFALYCVFGGVMRASNWMRGRSLFACKLSIPISAEMWAMAKYSMYAVFCARCHVAFRNTRFRLSVRTLTSLYVAIGVLWMAFSVLQALTVTGSDEHTHYAADGRRVDDQSTHDIAICTASVPASVLAVGVFADVFFVLVFLALFTTRMHKMFAMERDIGSNGIVSATRNFTDIEIRLLPFKLTVLTSIAVVSTLLSIISVFALNVTVLISVDCVVNSVALLLMTKYWKATFWRMCGPLLRFISTAPWFGQQTEQNVGAMVVHYKQGSYSRATTL